MNTEAYCGTMKVNIEVEESSSICRKTNHINKTWPVILDQCSHCDSIHKYGCCTEAGLERVVILHYDCKEKPQLQQVLVHSKPKACEKEGLDMWGTKCQSSVLSWNCSNKSCRVNISVTSTSIHHCQGTQ